ncbi:MAG TPA: (deoxy)nucleoside triphosphate pyrophosphohydrolase [Candidatus Omnitrophota bacterium]|nr:(deoxy)nucleoside triphosphate pyrophosphohydrolase [Candidatus Omnitrophota bacterium]HPS20592.1 (deoxy)nucleoside triphosphate pyrophosphohydrolase [Candidatus Omnitrophota bacterium]
MTSDKTQIQLVTAAVIKHAGKILLAQRKRSDRHGGKWEFPGGKLEPNETPEAGLKREIKEELGVDASIGHFLCSVPISGSIDQKSLLAFEVTIAPEKISLHAHESVVWIDLSQIGDFDLLEADKQIVAFLIQKEK